MNWRALGVKPMESMCDNCPFGHSKEQAHMRNSLAKGRYNEICQSVFRGELFVCHKTSDHDDEGEWRPTGRDRECAGSIQFRETAWRNREDAERRAARA